MWKIENRIEFEEIIEDLIQDPEVLSMQDLPQHSKHINCLEHSIYVAYVTFLFCRRWNLDYVAATRAALLHDFALVNWETSDMGIKRLWQHPKMALKNATERYDLSEMQQDIIVKHMWPLTISPPRHKESFVVSMADKICAVAEMSHLIRVLKVKKNVSTMHT